MTGHCDSSRGLQTTLGVAGYISAGDAPGSVLFDRIAISMTMPHNHPGIAGRADGDGCPRCNAEHALRALLGRAEDHIDFTPPRPRWRVLRGGSS